MADEAEQPGTRAYDITFYALMAGAALAVAFMTWDLLSGGQATEKLQVLFRKVQPKLAVVRPLRSEGEQDAS